jgi:hypothetical protein
MERSRAHAMPAGVAMAGGLLALAALSGAHPAAADASTEGARPHQPVVLADEQDHHDPTPTPTPTRTPDVTDDPIVVGDPHDGMHEEDRTPPSDEGHGHVPDADHHEPTTSPEDGHGHGQPVPEGSGAPADGAPSIEPSPGHDGTGGHGDEGTHGATGGDDHGTSGDDDGHADTGGHGAVVDTSAKPREAVLGGFLIVNSIVLAAGAIVRRRDRTTAAEKAAAKAVRLREAATPAPGTTKDAPR